MLTGCSRAPGNNGISPGSVDSTNTEAILESMTYIGGMNYAKYRLEASQARASGKQKKMRPPTLCVKNELNCCNASSVREGTISTTSSRQSSAFRAVEEAAAARTAMLHAEAEAQRALARLADTRAECNEQHKVVAPELEAMQNSVKSSLRAANQQITVQSAKVDAKGYCLEEMRNLFLQRELRMEVQMAELNTQMHTMSTSSQAARDDGQARTNKPTQSSSQMAPICTPSQPVTLKTSPKTEPKVLKPSIAEKKTTKVHVCAPNSLSTILLPSKTSLAPTQDRGVDPMTTTSSTINLTATKATAGSYASSTQNEAYGTANARTIGATSMFLTANKGMPTSNLCASSTHKRDALNGDLSM